MRIKRVDDKTVKCFLSNEELEAYEINYQDFITHSDKAKQVVQEILEQAAVEVGYKPPKFAFDLQIMVLQDQGILLTLSENDGTANHAQKLLEYLKQMQQNLLDAGVSPGQTKDVADVLMEEASVKDVRETKVKAPVKSDQAIFVFETLMDVMGYAAVLPTTLRVKSALYEMGNRYYLCLWKGAASYERFSRSCIQAMEFGKLYSAQPGQELLLEEHGKCLITEKAIQKLRG